MHFLRHPELEGRHAYLSPSKPSWQRYDDQKLERMYVSHLEHLRGTEEHEYAARAIKLRHRQADEPKTINMYINDCIGWRMLPEVPLFWSNHCFGTTDAIGFAKNPKTGEDELRISDLKTGRTPTSFDQLLAYAALFCLEYEHKPWDIPVIELRIYQSNRIKLHVPDDNEVFLCMDRIVTGSNLLDQIRADYLS